MNIEDVLRKMIIMYEQSIKKGDKENGQTKKQSLIRSQILIQHLHRYIKEKLIEEGFDKNCIKDELQLMGKLKQKKQDICILPKLEDNQPVQKQPEPINWGELKNENIDDEFGREFTEKIISINVRSQLSSVRKNKDTLFERAFAEPLNLHLRCPKMCLGEVFLIPVYEYDDEAMKENKIKIKKPTTPMKKLDEKILEMSQIRSQINEIDNQIEEVKALNGGKTPNKDNYKDPIKRKLREKFKELRNKKNTLENELKNLKPDDINLGLTIRSTIQRYINFFSAINNRTNIYADFHKYEKCVLLIVDFSLKDEEGNPKPKLYSSTEELKADGLVNKDFDTELAELSFETFIDELLKEYDKRFPNVKIK
jgi:hypothetical protein